MGAARDLITREDYDRLMPALPFLRQADPEMIREFMATAYLARIPAGRDIFVEGDRTDGIALLLNGVVRVYKIGETGREITLYRFGLGESCILTANAILSHQSFPAIATVEQDAEAVMVPASAFREWVRRTDLWRDFLFTLLSQRLVSVMAIVDEVAFRRMDARVAGLLAQRGRAGNPVRITHQAIAAELGSSREVISRILEDFAGQGLVRTARGSIDILDAVALAERAAM
jgi:CRP/FNR family transcriptional regulator, anaerobic regulatory protein